VEFVAHYFDGETGGAIAFVVRGACVVIGKVEVRWNVASSCGLGSKAK